MTTVSERSTNDFQTLTCASTCVYLLKQEMTSAISRACLGILTSLQRHQNAGPFLFPFNPQEWDVEPELDCSILKKLDFQMIQNKLEQHSYKHPYEFFGELFELFQNAKSFWGPISRMHTMTITVENYLLGLVSKLSKRQKMLIGVFLDPESAQKALAIEKGIDTKNKTATGSLHSPPHSTCDETEDDEVSPNISIPSPVSSVSSEPITETVVRKPLSTARVCAYCHTRSTPMWRHGPPAFDPLCNSCGVKWRRGRILTEYKHSCMVSPVKRKAPSLPSTTKKQEESKEPREKRRRPALATLTNIPPPPISVPVSADFPGQLFSSDYDFLEMDTDEEDPTPILHEPKKRAFNNAEITKKCVELSKKLNEMPVERLVQVLKMLKPQFGTDLEQALSHQQDQIFIEISKMPIALINKLELF